MHSNSLLHVLHYATALGVLLPAAAVCGQPVTVGVGQSYPTIQSALEHAPRGAVVEVHRGVYAEALLTIARPLTLKGLPGAILDGGGRHTVLAITADDVTVEGLTIRNTGGSQTEERAGVRVQRARGCTIARNRFERAFFAVYLERAIGCRVTDNVAVGAGGSQLASGNGIHAWNSDSLTIVGNVVRGHRDGIYFEFVKRSTIARNESTENGRYGLHFMFSHGCRYQDNVFRANGNGVAVMYSNNVEVVQNTFADNVGNAAYGLLLKNINTSTLRDNQFAGNSIGLYLEDSNRNVVSNNRFEGNGWALKLLASSQANTFEHNAFERNTFDVGTNSRSSYSTFANNFWDRYRGYDRNRDGAGDLPYAPVRLFGYVVGDTPASLLLLRSTLVDLLDVAERVIPAIAPSALVDTAPLMERPRP